jgi:hypothetical protein
MGWREIYADGTTNLFRTVEPVEIEGTHGTMIERGDFAESFIPDVGAASARFYFRTSPSRWVWLSDTKDAR